MVTGHAPLIAGNEVHMSTVLRYRVQQVSFTMTLEDLSSKTFQEIWEYSTVILNYLYLRRIDKKEIFV